MSAAPASLRYAIDQLVVRDGRFFGWGWAADARGPVRRASLRVRGETWQRAFTLIHGLAREDVERAFPALPHARHSGLVMTGYLPDEQVRDATLVLALGNGEEASVDVGDNLRAAIAGRVVTGTPGALRRSVWRRLREGDLRGLVAGARARLAPRLARTSGIAPLLPALRDARDVAIVFDHAMGGGANAYRDQEIAARVAAGGTVLLCAFELATLACRVTLHAPGRSAEVRGVASYRAMEDALAACDVAEITVNSAVSFGEPQAFAEWIADTRAAHPALRLVVAVHEYFAACPSYVLLDADGRYCGIPDVATCARCLPRHAAPYVALSPPADIPAWRASWLRCLAAADEVRCFSASSERLLLRAFPTLAPERIRVVPHRVDFRPERLPRLDHAAPLTIGVMGFISEQKGAGIVRGMAEAIAQRGLDARIVVLGTLDGAEPSPALAVTGPYRRDALPELIEAHRINVFLFPSICPETFSYAIEELIRLRVPIVAFDLGAPGERLRGYAGGRLCAQASVDAALDAVQALHAELAGSAAGVPQGVAHG